MLHESVTIIAVVARHVKKLEFSSRELSDKAAAMDANSVESKLLGTGDGAEERLCSAEGRAGK
jgi:hypothetical protein